MYLVSSKVKEKCPRAPMAIEDEKVPANLDGNSVHVSISEYNDLFSGNEKVQHQAICTMDTHDRQPNCLRFRVPGAAIPDYLAG